MPAHQLKAGAVVIEIGVLPVGGSMTCRAVGAILALMFVILLMAGIAVPRSSQKDPVDVAGLARDFLVLSLQLEDRQVVIESGGCPAGFGMAIGTVQTQSSLVRFLFLVTGETIRRS